jgi:outer membrane cobalamin receptor
MLFAPTSSQAGGGSRLSLRGNSSLERVSPLVFIDDIRITESPVVGALDQMPPQDVLLIEVFRGPAATTLWGTGASGGVIRVYSRQGHPRSEMVGDSKAWCVP